MATHQPKKASQGVRTIFQKLPNIWNWNNQESNNKKTKYNQQRYEVVDLSVNIIFPKCQVSFSKSSKLEIHLSTHP